MSKSVMGHLEGGMAILPADTGWRDGTIVRVEQWDFISTEYNKSAPADTTNCAALWDVLHKMAGTVDDLED